MITVVLDSNVLASGFVRPHGAPGALLGAWRAEAFDLVVSDHILSEVTRTLDKPYFAQRLTTSRRTANIALLRSDATITPLTVPVRGVATHPEDDRVLATAVSAQADYLVTGDHKLLQLRSYEGVGILSPRDFLNLLLTGGGTVSSWSDVFFAALISCLRTLGRLGAGRPSHKPPIKRRVPQAPDRRGHEPAYRAAEVRIGRDGNIRRARPELNDQCGSRAELRLAVHRRDLIPRRTCGGHGRELRERRCRPAERIAAGLCPPHIPVRWQTASRRCLGS